MSSLPTRGAWIEINTANPRNAHCCRRSPPGERGLKSCEQGAWCAVGLSLPTRGAWIEIRPESSQKINVSVQ